MRALASKDLDDFDWIVSSKVISKLLGVSDARIRQLTKENAVVRAGHGKYDLLKSIKAYVAFIRKGAIKNERND